MISGPHNGAHWWTVELHILCNYLQFLLQSRQWKFTIYITANMQHSEWNWTQNRPTDSKLKTDLYSCSVCLRIYWLLFFSAFVVLCSLVYLTSTGDSCISTNILSYYIGYDPTSGGRVSSSLDYHSKLNWTFNGH